MIICQRTSDGQWIVTGTRPEPIPPAGWDLLIRIIRAFLGTLSSPEPPPSPPLPMGIAMATSRRSGSPHASYADHAVHSTQNVAGNPALDLLIPVVIDVAAGLLARCRSEQDACAAMAAASDAQRARLVAQTRRQLKADGTQRSIAEVRAAVDAACKAAANAKSSERVAFLHGAYSAKGSAK